MSPAADLAHRLARDAEAVCRYYLPHGRREGRYWLVGDVADTPGRSLFVRLHGPDHGKGAAGRWQDAALGRVWRSARPHRLEPPARPVPRRARRGARLPQPAAAGARVFPSPAGSLRIAGSRPPAVRHGAADQPARWPRPICAGAASRPCTAPAAYASTPAATTVRMMAHLSRPGRR